MRCKISSIVTLCSYHYYCPYGYFLQCDVLVPWWREIMKHIYFKKCHVHEWLMFNCLISKFPLAWFFFWNTRLFKCSLTTVNIVMGECKIFIFRRPWWFKKLTCPLWSSKNVMVTKKHLTRTAVNGKRFALVVLSSALTVLQSSLQQPLIHPLRKTISYLIYIIIRMHNELFHGKYVAIPNVPMSGQQARELSLSPLHL